MGKLFLNIVSLSLSGAVIGGILILFHPLTRKHFSKKWNYYIWLILALRLLIPAGFGFSPFHMTYPLSDVENQGTAENIERRAESEGIEELETKGEPGKIEESGKTGRREEKEALEGTREAEGIAGLEAVVVTNPVEKMIDVLSLLWLFGVIAVFFIKLVHYRKLVKRTKSFCRPVADKDVIITANVVALRLHLRKNVVIYESPRVSGPVTMGLFNPFVVLPVEERRAGDTALILHHELLHVKRKDLWYKWLWQLILCIHWFNPVLYRIQKILSEDCELSCDEQILKQLSDKGKRAYGNVLLDTAQKNLDFGETVFLTTLLEEKEALKERLEGIIEYKKQSRLKILVSVCAMIFVMSLSACGTVIVFKGSEDVSGNSAYNTEEDGWSFWDIFKTDENDFLAGFPKIDGGDAYGTYDSDEMIAGTDRSDLWRAYYYMGGDRIKCKGLGFNGSDSIYIIYAKEDTVVEISSEFEVVEGKFKIVSISPDNQVSILNESGDFNTAAVQLGEGRNVIKMVGKAAKIKKLEVDHSPLDMEAVENIYYSPEEEYADVVLAEIQKGNIDKVKIWEVLPYMEEKAISEMLGELCKQGVTLTTDELTDIFIYGDEELAGRYLSDAIRNKEIQSINGEALRSIMYYMESETLAELIMTMDKKELTFDVLLDCTPYLDEDEAGDCLLYYLELGNSLTYSQYTQISYYLSREMKEEIESKMEFKEKFAINPNP